MRIVGPATTAERRNGGAGTTCGSSSFASSFFPSKDCSNATGFPGSARTHARNEPSYGAMHSTAAAPSESDCTSAEKWTPGWNAPTKSTPSDAAPAGAENVTAPFP